MPTNLVEQSPAKSSALHAWTKNKFRSTAIFRPVTQFHISIKTGHVCCTTAFVWQPGLVSFYPCCFLTGAGAWITLLPVFLLKGGTALVTACEIKGKGEREKNGNGHTCVQVHDLLLPKVRMPGSGQGMHEAVGLCSTYTMSLPPVVCMSKQSC